LFLPFHFMIFSHFAIVRKLLGLILFILLLWPEPHDLTLESCFLLVILVAVVSPLNLCSYLQCRGNCWF
jgi:hypothetical protein